MVYSEPKGLSHILIIQNESENIDFELFSAAVSVQAPKFRKTGNIMFEFELYSLICCLDAN